MLLVFLTQCVGLTIAGLEAPIIFALFCALTDFIVNFISRVAPNQMIEAGSLKKDITAQVTDWGMQFGSVMEDVLFITPVPLILISSSLNSDWRTAST